MVIFHSYVAVYQRIILPKTPAPQHASYAQVPGHRGDEACDAGRTAGRRVVGAADAVVLDGLGWALFQKAVAGTRGDGTRPGKQPHNYGKSSFLMGKLTNSFAIENGHRNSGFLIENGGSFHSYVKLPDGWEDGGEDGFWGKKNTKTSRKHPVV